MIVPEEYAAIDRVVISFLNGRKIAIDGDDAVNWAQAVDWGLRRLYVEQFEKYGKVITQPNWKEVYD